MSDTPRTDEAECFIDSDRGITDSGLARHLERELNEANQRIKRLEEAGDRMLELYEEIGTDSYDKDAMSLWRKAKEAKP